MTNSGRASRLDTIPTAAAGGGAAAPSTPSLEAERALHFLPQARERLPGHVPAAPEPEHKTLPAEKDATAPAGGRGLVSRRPPSRPRNPRRRAFGAVIVMFLVAGAVVGVRYGWPRVAEHYPILPQALAVEISGPAILDAINQTSVAATIPGRIVTLPVDRNDVVKAGDVIATIKSDDLERQLAAAEASVESANLAVRQAEAEMRSADAAQQNAQESHDRLQKLVSSGTVTQASYDAGLATLRKAVAEHAAAEAAVARAEAEHKAAISNADVQRTYLDDAVVRAPIDGVIVSRSRNAGDVVSVGTAIVSIVDPKSIVMSARFDESAIASIHPGQDAALVFPSRPDAAIAGSVLRLGREVDNETREFTADITPKTLPTNWALGQRGRAMITIETKDNVLAAPSELLSRRDGQAGLWVASHGRAHWRPVTLGEVGDGRVEIRDGLQPGEILLKRDRLFEGMRVHPPSATS
ncbi:efflux RND transporter periplasmic adaptor subunit [Acuticoccus kandeliae]|uniref:efflux RND transporter periplasmic adaptor subunit n=1 Tax=Acuticoccus kandeliae TaxID=2073160 RepID=UPI001300AF3F|nr:efflux RND transporter periplasmic adaptor subunit [Acuticoccus kandeliae]